ncbi:MAG: [Fe-Fe] hydrogenase large subunit C-terminal domain-containing protein [Evtepia gabavorous]
MERFTHPGISTLAHVHLLLPRLGRFVETQFPKYVGHLSTAKSPQQMFGAVAKSYFAKKLGTVPHDIFVVSIMPCAPRKTRQPPPCQRTPGGDPDVDVVLTTRELVRMFRVSRSTLPSWMRRPLTVLWAGRHRRGGDLRCHRRCRWMPPSRTRLLPCHRPNLDPRDAFP